MSKTTNAVVAATAAALNAQRVASRIETDEENSSTLRSQIANTFLADKNLRRGLNVRDTIAALNYTGTIHNVRRVFRTMKVAGELRVIRKEGKREFYGPTPKTASVVRRFAGE